MKKILFCMALFSVLFVQAQDQRSLVLSQARMLNEAVFVKKDSLVLAGLFLDQLTYGHSSGKIERRKEALHNIIHNASVYENVQLRGEEAWVKNKTAVTRYLLTAIEKKADGSSSPLRLHIVLVWAKEKKDWKLLSRQAVRVP